MPSDNQFVLRPGLSCQLESAFMRNGWTVAEVNELSKGQNLRRVLLILREEAKLTFPEYTLNEDVVLLPQDGFGYEHWRFELNDILGTGTFCLHDDLKLYINNRAVQTAFLPNGFADLALVQGLVGERKPLNLSYMRFLLNNQKLIPWEWQALKSAIWFSGTIMSAYVTYMHREENWRTKYILFGLKFEQGAWKEVFLEGNTLKGAQSISGYQVFF